MPDQHVFENAIYDDGTHRHSAAHLNDAGALVITTHDLGPGVLEFFGVSEYEATETFTAGQTAQLRGSLGDDLIDEEVESQHLAPHHDVRTDRAAVLVIEDELHRAAGHHR